ncbi:E3 ubiquitin-protein ligase TRIM21-like [Centropristis striata]|uniref:E3 ubiquitin-protein ligase TRIM21-like n=1 Tax=Centropristis striata TaxID=184440 RepID=UPI0027E1949D|nr:E3 ubiquitin-protein ligase TRIM21-like [Centropristis striata]XP_059201985.1 E3 ubiquitin-protein ligase TRIM21-like [Centropristis striata]
MATASRGSLIIEDNFLCSICLDVFKKPVSIPCGHNFCLDCIKDYWDTNKTIFQCPLCKEQYLSRPMLRVNTVIAEIAAKFKQSVEDGAAGSSEEAGNGNVLCDRCTGAKLPAVKSCLVCFMSFCDAHLEPHHRIPAMKKHKLIHPVENLESRMCKTHDEPLELFCRVEQMFVCQSCKDSDHKSHKIVSLEEEAQVRKTQLGMQKESMDHMIQVRQQKIQEIQESAEVSRENAKKALSRNQHVMTAVVDYIRRSQAELTEVIETKQEKIEKETRGVIKELEGEIMQIKERSLQLNKVSIKEDALMCLENILSLTITAPQVKDWSDVTINSDKFTEQGAIARLETTVRREIRMLCDPDLKEMQRHAVDVSLDPDTANPHLHISSDGKQVTHADRKRNVPNKPERFEHVLNVLAKDGFCSGKFYYEVQVKGKTNWDLGIANQSINRKGDIRLSPKNGYWTIWLRKGNELTANAGPAVTLQVREMPQKVGVFVDYELGRVSFYDVDTRACMFSFSGCDFTEKIYPFFSPCANDGGKNMAALIITSVKKNI